MPPSPDGRGGRHSQGEEVREKPKTARADTAASRGQSFRNSPKDTLDYIRLGTPLDERDDPHLAAAPGALERVGIAPP